MRLATRPLSENVGIEVLGLPALEDGSDYDADTRAELERLFVRHGVMLFRGVGTSPQALMAVSRCFGTLGVHPVKESLLEGFPEIINLPFYAAEPGQPPAQPVYQVGGAERAGWLPWHTDLIYMDRINRGGILRAVQVPDEAGRTGFIDKIRIYETLPEELKRRIEGLSVIYQFQPQINRQKFCQPAGLKLLSTSPAMDRLMARIDRDFPPVVHPLVYDQPGTGRKVLNISPMNAVGIHGMETAEGDALLAEVVRHCIRAEHAWFHDWQVNDLVLWDNWRALHAAEGVPLHCTRVMQRTSIDGDYALGRRLDEPRRLQ
jgi:taurine dioxygenase